MGVQLLLVSRPILAARKNTGDRLAGNYSASAEVGTFLSRSQRGKSRNDDGRCLFGAEAEWNMLEPRFAQLADIYNIGWQGDPSSWNARRIGDRELQELISELGKESKGFSKLLGPDLEKSNELDKMQRRHGVASGPNSARSKCGLDSDGEASYRLQTHG